MIALTYLELVIAQVYDNQYKMEMNTKYHYISDSHKLNCGVKYTLQFNIIINYYYIELS